MAKKLTALEKARTAAASAGGGQSPLVKTLAVLLVLLGLAGALFAGWQIAANRMYAAGQEAVESGAQDLARSLGDTLVTRAQAIREAAAASELRAAFEAGEREALSSAEASLRQRLPEANRVRLVLGNVEKLDPQPFPGLGYAGLALLLQAKSSGEMAGPGVGLVRTQNAHMSWAVPIPLDDDRIGLVLVSYPMTIIGRQLDQVDVGSGYLDFRTGSSRHDLLIAASRGALAGREPGSVPAVSVEGADFSVGYYRAKPPFHLGMSSVAMAVLAGFSLFLVAMTVLWRVRPELLARLAIRRAPGEEEAAPERTLAEMSEVDDDLRSAMDFADQYQEDSVGHGESGTDVPQEIFRAYDIRGIVGKTLTSTIARDIGRAIGSEARDRGVKSVVVARDGRLSGPDMSAALIKGLCAAGVDVIDIGAVPTGVLYFATHHLETGSGVMVTGSHNPPDYNGFKIVLAGHTLSGEDIQDLYHRLLERRLSDGSGGVQEMDVVEEYVDRIASDVQVEEPLKVVVDAGNGIGGRVAPLVLEEIGCEVVPLYCEVDGNFPNHHPDPSDPANLQDLIVSVKQLDADLGVALDGDGDRLGVVTREGEIVYPDRLLMLFARDVLTRNPGAAVIYDVKCTGALAREILSHGGSPVMWKTGHSLIKGKMKEAKAALAGEMSGHFFFQERWYGFDDGIYSCARLLEILAAEGQPPSDTLNALPTSHSTPELKVEMAEGEHFAFIKEFLEKARFEDARITDIDGLRADFDDGWGLVRCSNTTPSLVLRFEGATPEALTRVKDVFREQILAVRPKLDLPF